MANGFGDSYANSEVYLASGMTGAAHVDDEVYLLSGSESGDDECGDDEFKNDYPEKAGSLKRPSVNL